MVKRTGPTNYQLQGLIKELNEKAIDSKVALWSRLAKDLNKPSRQRRSVNVYKINKYAREGEVIVVPGKVLSVGELSKNVEVAAFSFSDSAREKIHKMGKTLTITELMNKNPNGKKVRILG